MIVTTILIAIVIYSNNNSNHNNNGTATLTCQGIPHGLRGWVAAEELTFHHHNMIYDTVVHSNMVLGCSNLSSLSVLQPLRNTRFKLFVTAKYHIGLEL